MPAVARSRAGIFSAGHPASPAIRSCSTILSGSGHFPDTFQVMPVFLDARLIGLVACSAHQVDMGGAAPGSQKVHGVTEAFQEGLRILPVRFVREGEIQEDILRLILGNVRMPDKVRGDLLAQHTANLTAAARLQAVPRPRRRPWSASMHASSIAPNRPCASRRPRCRPGATPSRTISTTTGPAPTRSAWPST